MTKGALVVIGCGLLLSGCEEERGGIAFLHITDLDEPCPAYSPSAVATFAVMPFRRAHAVAAFQGGSDWDGGNLVAMAWQDDDGTVNRLFYDLGPERGYGITLPTPAYGGSVPIEEQETSGFVQWNGGVRIFAAQRGYGIVNYRKDSPPGSGDRDDTHLPGEFFAQMAYEGVDADGDVVCKVLGVHGSPSRARVDPYDPSWLTPNPSMMMSVTVEPTFADDRAPGADLIEPALAGPDPGGEPPRMLVLQPEVDQGGGDGSDGCE